MMAKRLRIASGIAAIWEGAGDILPFTSPLSYLSRLKFHSSFDYIRATKRLTYTLNVPATGSVAVKVASYVLGTHGVAGQPFIIGKIVVNGVPVAFSGSVPVHQFTTGETDVYARFLSLGVNATSIVVHEYSVQGGNPEAYRSRPAQSFQVTVEVTDMLL